MTFSLFFLHYDLPGDGTLRAAKDTVVETLTTGEDGTAQSGLLYLGRYRLEERQAPEGMVLNTQPEYAELTYAGETVEITQTAIGLYDERQKVTVGLFKTLETDELFGLGMNEEYKDISFGLYASADLTAADGSVIPAGGLQNTRIPSRIYLCFSLFYSAVDGNPHAGSSKICSAFFQSIHQYPNRQQFFRLPSRPF